MQIIQKLSLPEKINFEIVVDKVITPNETTTSILHNH